MTFPLPSLQGRRLESICFDSDCHEWVFAFAGIVLRCVSPWRLTTRGGIEAGWRDDGQWFGLGAPMDLPGRVRSVVGSGAVAAASYDAKGDLTVRFENDSQLEAFNSSCGYEGWILRGPGQRWVVAQGGGRVVEGEG